MTHYLKSTTIQIATDFSPGTTEERKKWQTIFKALKEKYCQHGTLYPLNIYILQDESEI